MTKLEIVNRALRHIGAVAATSLADTAKSAARALETYDYSLAEVLRLVEWPCCTKRVRLKGAHDQATPWAASTAYFVGARCTNDSSKTYECLTAGTSAGSGGPTGTSDSITDGTVVWTYVEASTTANNWCWKASTAYVVNDLVTNNVGKVYVCITAGTSAGSGGPTGTTADITDGSVHWRYYGTITENLTVYEYCYVIPPDCRQVAKIIDQDTTTEDAVGEQYRREGIFLYCDQDESVLKYVYLESDPTLWDDTLQRAVALKIASDIAYDITGDKGLADRIFSDFAGSYGTARVLAIGEGSSPPAEEPRWEDVG